MSTRSALVVDDSKLVRGISRKILEGFGFAVVEAEDGQVALTQCTALLPEVILLDWNMPVMSGIEFLRAFRSQYASATTLIIFCTTENDTSKIQEALSAGANEYVMKPFDADIIHGKLLQLGLLTA